MDDPVGRDFAVEPQNRLVSLQCAAVVPVPVSGTSIIGLDQTSRVAASGKLALSGWWSKRLRTRPVECHLRQAEQAVVRDRQSDQLAIRLLPGEAEIAVLAEPRMLSERKFDAIDQRVRSFAASDLQRDCARRNIRRREFKASLTVGQPVDEAAVLIKHDSDSRRLRGQPGSEPLERIRHGNGLVVGFNGRVSPGW